MATIKYICIKCDFKYSIVENTKDTLKKKKHNDICPECNKKMSKSEWNDDDIRLSNAIDFIMQREN